MWEFCGNPLHTPSLPPPSTPSVLLLNSGSCIAVIMAQQYLPRFQRDARCAQAPPEGMLRIMDPHIGEQLILRPVLGDEQLQCPDNLIVAISPGSGFLLRCQRLRTTLDTISVVALGAVMEQMAASCQSLWDTSNGGDDLRRAKPLYRLLSVDVVGIILNAAEAALSGTNWRSHHARAGGTLTGMGKL